MISFIISTDEVNMYSSMEVFTWICKMKICHLCSGLFNDKCDGSKNTPLI